MREWGPDMGFHNGAWPSFPRGGLAPPTPRLLCGSLRSPGAPRPTPRHLAVQCYSRAVLQTNAGQNLSSSTARGLAAASPNFVTKRAAADFYPILLCQRPKPKKHVTNLVREYGIWCMCVLWG
jgi:hypothetical protein